MSQASPKEGIKAWAGFKKTNKNMGTIWINRGKGGGLFRLGKTQARTSKDHMYENDGQGRHVCIGDCQ